MSSFKTLAGIPIDRVDTADPLIANWAIDRICDLRNRSVTSADDAARTLFDESTIRLLLTHSVDDILHARLLQELPDDLLQPHLSFIADSYSQIPEMSVYDATDLLARLSPDRALLLFIEFLKEPSNCLERLYAILQTASELPDPHLKRVADAAVEMIFREGADPKLNTALFLLVAYLAWEADHPESINILKVIVNAIPDHEPDAIDSDLKNLTFILMTTAEPLKIMTNLLAGYAVPHFSDLPRFLTDSYLALQLDDVVKKLGELDNQAALDFYEHHKNRLPERVIAVLELCRDAWQIVPGTDKFEVSSNPYSLFPACIAATAWNNNPEPPADDTKAIISFLVTNLSEVPINEAVSAHFAAMDKQQAIDCLTDALVEEKDGYGVLRIVEIMARLGYPEFIRLFIDNTDSVFELLCERCATALLGYGEEAVGAIIDILESNQAEQNYYLLDILAQSGCEQAVAYFDRHFNELAKTDKDALGSAIEALPEQRFIERLAPLTGKGQNTLDRAYLVLNRLHGINSPELSRLEEDYIESEAKRLELRDCFENSGLAAITPDVLNLEMKCSSCGDISRYEVASIFYSKTDAKPFVADELQCIACAAEDTLLLSSLSSILVTEEVLRIMGIEDEKLRKEAEESSPITITPRLTAMGREMGIQDAIELYKKEIATHPTRTEHYLGYANILRFIGRLDRARDCYNEAVRIEPRLIEGWFELAQIAETNGDYRKAFLALHEGSLQLPNILIHHLNPSERSDFINDYVASYNSIKKFLSIPGSELNHGMFATQAKVGRNDPCSCGSGKKYKKCCGR